MAAALASRGAVAVEASIDAHCLRDRMSAATRHQDEPLAGPALVAQYRAYEAAAGAGLKVVLEGTGSDELFAGYPRHQVWRLRDYRRRGAWLQGAASLTAAVARDPVMRAWVSSRLLGRLRRRVAGPSRWAATIAPALAAGPGDPPPDQARAAAPNGTSLLTRALFHDVINGNVPLVLGIGDRNAMAHGIESRVPFLDHRLVELAFRLPDDVKARHGQSKRALREVAERRLPAMVARRRARIGFGLPIGPWMRGPLRADLLEAARAPEISTSGVFRPAETVELVAGFLDGRHEEGAPVWRVYALAQWWRAFTPTL
jgi:asparagine synthase (glutamine-hydrolysing)